MKRLPRDPPRRPFELDDAYIEGLVAYSKATGSNLQVAIYWAQWNIWTLIPPSSLLKNSFGSSF
jgi:hypothetical protein